MVLWVLLVLLIAAVLVVQWNTCFLFRKPTEEPSFVNDAVFEGYVCERGFWVEKWSSGDFF